jgi:hypothetical protein
MQWHDFNAQFFDFGSKNYPCYLSFLLAIFVVAAAGRSEFDQHLSMLSVINDFLRPSVSGRYYLAYSFITAG